MNTLLAVLVLGGCIVFYLLILVMLALITCHIWLELKERLEERRRLRSGGKP